MNDGTVRWQCPQCLQWYYVPKNQIPTTCPECQRQPIVNVPEESVTRRRRKRGTSPMVRAIVWAATMCSLTVFALVRYANTPQPPQPQVIHQPPPPQNEQNETPHAPQDGPPVPQPQSESIEEPQASEQSPEPEPIEEEPEPENEPPPKPALANKPSPRLDFGPGGYRDWHPATWRAFRAKIVQYDLRYIRLQNRDGELHVHSKPLGKLSEMEKWPILVVIHYYTRKGSRTPLAGRKDVRTLEDLQTHFPALYADEAVFPFHAVVFAVSGQKEHKVFPVYAFDGKEREYLWQHAKEVMKPGGRRYAAIRKRAKENREFMQVDELLPE